MNLKKALLLFAALVFASFVASSVDAQWISIGVGVPGYRPYPYYRPYYAHPYYAYPYRYGIYVPAPIYVTRPPVYYPQPVPMASQYYNSIPPSSVMPTPPRSASSPTFTTPAGTPQALTGPPSPSPTQTTPPPPPQPMRPSTPPVQPAKPRPPSSMPLLVPPTPEPIPLPPGESPATNPPSGA